MGMGVIVITIDDDAVLLKKGTLSLVDLICKVASPLRIVRCHIITWFMYIEKVASQLDALLNNFHGRHNGCNYSGALHIRVAALYAVTSIVSFQMRMVRFYSFNHFSN